MADHAGSPGVREGSRKKAAGAVATKGSEQHNVQINPGSKTLAPQRRSKMPTSEKKRHADAGVASNVSAEIFSKGHYSRRPRT